MSARALSITQVRSLIGSKSDQRRTMRSLGLRRIRHTVVQPDSPQIRGMIAKVSHLVEVRELDQDVSSRNSSSRR
jgi:large subunit ribosomal protein L30